MTEILIQSVQTERKGAQLADEASQLRQHCSTDHADKKDLIECPECYEKIIESFRSRYLSSAENEWFSSRRVFLQDLATMLDSVKEYRIDPKAVDDRIREERSRWYAETVRSSILRLMVEDTATREVVFEKLEDTQSDFTASAPEITKLLTESPIFPRDQVLEGLPERLVAAKESEERIEVLKEAFLSMNAGAGEGSPAVVPEDHQKYLQMLQNGLSMEQMVDRVLEERQTAVTSRDQAEKLKQRLHELRRARAAHEAEKSKKERKRARLAEEIRVPDELYDLAPCLACGRVPETKDFYSCPICTVFASWKVQDSKPVVYCQEHDDPKDQVRTSHPSSILK